MTNINKKNNVVNQEVEIDRLVRNSRALLDVLPAMVFLVAENRVIQYMNKAALHAFGDLQGKSCSDFLCNDDNNCALQCPLVWAAKGVKNSKPVEIRTVTMEIEYNYLPFLGYEGHHLTMLLM